MAANTVAQLVPSLGAPLWSGAAKVRHPHNISAGQRLTHLFCTAMFRGGVAVVERVHAWQASAE